MKSGIAEKPKNGFGEESQGLGQSTYEQCHRLSEQIPKRSKVKKHLQAWLARHMDTQR